MLNERERLEILKRLESAERQIRLGKVISVDEKNRKASVSFIGKGGSVTLTLPVMTTIPEIEVSKTYSQGNFSVNMEQGASSVTVKTQYDLTGSISYASTVTVKAYLPKAGQLVICAFLPGENADGFILGGI